MAARAILVAAALAVALAVLPAVVRGALVAVVLGVLLAVLLVAALPVVHQDGADGAPEAGNPDPSARRAPGGIRG